MKAMCLQAMAIVYGQCYEEIGPFNDTPFIVHKLEKVCGIRTNLPLILTPLFLCQCEDREERDRLLMFIDKLLYHKKNVKLFLDAGGVKIVVDLITLAHLHISRAYVPLQVPCND